MSADFETAIAFGATEVRCLACKPISSLTATTGPPRRYPLTFRTLARDPL